MAVLYAKTAGGNWTAAGTWSTTGSGGGDSSGPPGAGDDAVFESGSGNVTINTGAVCRSWDCTAGTGNYAGTITHTAGVTLTIGTTTDKASNVALKLVAGMTYSPSAASCAITFARSSGTTTAQTVDTAGFSVGNMTFGGTTSGFWQLSTALTTRSDATITFTTGKLDTNGKAVDCGGFSSNNSNTRTITLGSSAITNRTNAQGFTWGATNLTVTANTAVITFNGAGGSADLRPQGVNFNGASVVITGAGNYVFGSTTGTAPTFANFTRTGTAITTDSVTFQSGITITSALTFNSDSSINRLLVRSDIIGTARSLSAGSLVCTNVVDFMDITGAGAATWTTGASGASAFGDCLGNSGITFTTGQTNYGVGVSSQSNFSDSTKWASSSGGTGGTGRVPLPQDTIRLDANTGTSRFNINMPRFCKDMDCTGYAGTDLRNVSSNTMYGSLTLASGNIGTTNNGMTFSGRSSQTITTAGNTIWQSTISAPGGTYTLQDDVTFNTSLTVSNGTFDANNHNVTLPGFNSSASTTRAVTMGSGTWTLSGTGTIWTLATSTGLTFSGASAPISVTDTSGTAKTFAGGGKTYNNLTYTVATVPSTLTITGANTFNTMTVGSGRAIVMPASTTNTFTSFSATGANNGYEYLPGVASNYISVPDSSALSITGNIDIRLKLALDSWTSPANQKLFNKVQSASQISWRLQMNAAATSMVFAVSSDGSAQTNATSTAAATVTNGVAKWVRVTWRASDGRVQFFTSDDSTNNPSSVTWTQLGADRTANVGSIFDSTSEVAIGEETGGSGTAAAVGKFYRAQIRNNILDDGTGIQFDADFTTRNPTARTFTESSSNAATVTLNGTSAQAGGGAVVLASSTTNTAATVSKSSGIVSCDYMSISDSTATGGASWYAGANSTDAGGNTGWIFTAVPAGGANLLTMGVG